MQIPTNPMYDIDEFGVVRLISTGAVIPEYRNHKHLRAVKIRGRSHRPASHTLDRLMLNTYKPLPHGEDPDWWSVKFVDKDKNNILITNLEWDNTWVTPISIPGITIGLTDWIPAYGHPHVELRLFSDGMGIRNSKTHSEIGFRLNADGYCLVQLPFSDKPIRLHRLVALTFLPHPLDTDHLTVNHKDSDKENNTPFNLEWATYSENNFHAFLEGPRSNTVRKIVAINLETGLESVYSGHNDLARYLGILPGSIHAVMDRRAFEGRPYKGYVFKYSDDIRSWEELRKSGPVKKRVFPEKVACCNMDSGQISIYDSISAIEEAEGINSHALFRLLSKDVMIPWRRKCFQEVVKNKKLVWPDYSKEILDVYEKVHSSDKPIKVTDGEGNVKYYPNVTSWCMEDRENRCDPAVMSRYMKKSKICRWHNWVLEHIDLSAYLHRR